MGLSDFFKDPQDNKETGSDEYKPVVQPNDANADPLPASEGTPVPDEPATQNNIDDEPQVVTRSVGEKGKPGYNEITYVSQVDEDFGNIDPEVGEKMFAPVINNSLEGDTRYEDFAENVGTAGSEPYKETNDLTPDTNDAESNVASRDNIVPSVVVPVSEDDVLGREAHVDNLTDVISRLDNELAKDATPLAEARDHYTRLSNNYDQKLATRAAAVDELAAAELKRLPDVPSPNDDENPTTSTTPLSEVHPVDPAEPADSK